MRSSKAREHGLVLLLARSLACQTGVYRMSECERKANQDAAELPSLCALKMKLLPNEQFEHQHQANTFSPHTY